MKKTMLNEFTGKEIRELLSSGRQLTAITCFGSCENHADHLPLGCDHFVPEAVARLVAERVPDTIALPCVPFGTSLHYNSYPMAITLRFETNVAIAEDIFESLVKQGIKRIVIFNGHDGNIPALEIAARNVKSRHADVAMIYIPAWWDAVGKILGNEFFDSWAGTGLGHGGEGETSMVLATRPELVDMAQARCEIPHDVFNYYGVTFIWDIAEISATGHTGDATKATIAKGEKMTEALVDFIVGILEKLNANGWAYDYHQAAK